MRLSAWLLVVSLAGCGDDGGIGISLLEASDLVDGEGDEAAVLSVFVSRGCFYSISVNGALLGSGRWASGKRTVRLGPAALQYCDNDVRIQVAAQDGSSTVLDTQVFWCEGAPCAVECEGVEPPPDAGGVDPYPGPLCDSCYDTNDCGGLPNLCTYIEGAATGLCGTECYGSEDCPNASFQCLEFDQNGIYVTSVCLPWPPAPTCP